jgi:DNA (cytosine-5)-methyltransferase 1
MRYISLFSGIEAASVAWKPLGWKPVAFAELDTFPSAVLAHHYPSVPNLGDVTKIDRATIDGLGRIDLAVFGFPCQDLSVAGKRAGLSDEAGTKTRSGLFYDAARISFQARARWVVAENVPGLLSSKGGRDFAAVLAELTGLDVPVPSGRWKNFGIVRTDVPGRYSVAWRILDAQYVGGCPVHGERPVPQRRRRVFIVGHSGDWTHPAQVLLEPEGLCWDSKKGKGKKKKAATDAGFCLTARNGSGRNDPTAQNYIVHTLRGEGFDASEDGTGRGTPIVPIAVNARQDHVTSETALPLDTDGNTQAIMFDPYNNAVSRQSPTLGINCGMSTGRSIAVTPQIFEARVARNGRGAPEDICPPLKAQSGGTGKGDSAPLLNTGIAVRRLMPEECEALQGFPRGYTQVPFRGKTAADGPRYKAIGNSMAVPCMLWLGRRIQALEAAR